MAAVATAQPPVIRPTGGLPNIPAIGNRTPGSGTGDSLRRRVIDSVTLRIYYLDSVRPHTIDSSVTDYYLRYPIPAHHTYIGNLGSATRSLLFQPNTTPGFDPGFHTLDVYRMQLPDVRFYQTNRPYTELNYSLGTKAEQMIEILHTQNITANWNASFNYHLLSAPGIFRNQRNNHNSYVFTSWYQGTRRRYNNYFVFLFNKLQAGESGGIVSTDFLNDPIYSRDRFTVPSNIGGNPRFGTDLFSTALYTGRRERDLTLYMRQQYDFGRSDSIVNDSIVIPLFFPKVRFEHDIRFTRSGFLFQDLGVNDGRQSNTPDTAYYLTRYDLPLRNDSLSMEDTWTQISNVFSIYQFPDEKNLQQFFKVGGELQLISGQLRTPVSYYNFIGRGEYRNRTKNQKWDMLATGRLFLAGLNAGDYKAYISLQRTFAERSGSLQIGFENVNRSPSFIFRPESHFYLHTATDFSKENIAHFFGAVVEPKTGIQLTGDYYLVTNYLYIKDFKDLRQERALFNVLRVGASKTFKLSRYWNWYANAHLQQKAGAVELNMPLFFTRNMLAFEGTFFKNLNLSTGLDVKYHSPYRADNYSPVLGQFFYQDSLTISNRPDVAAFLHMRIRSLSTYLRVENLNTISSQGGFLDHNFAAPLYPTPGLFVRLGIFWSFVN